MGVDISVLVKGRPVSLEDLTGRSIAIDAFNTLYQFVSMIRQPDGTPLMDRDGRVTSHLSGLFYRTAALLELGIRPAYVFDGKPPELKRKTIEARIAAKQEAEVEWKKALEEGDLKRALSKATRTAKLDSDMIEESLSLLDGLGVPWIKAPSEGEAQMGHMARKGDVWAGASQDFDAILFGTPTLVRNLTLAGKRRLPSGKTVDVTPELVTLSDVLGELQVSREQLVDMGVLMGTDFNDGVKGIGPKKALAIIKKHGRLEDVPMDGKVPVPEEFKEVRAIFLEPDVSDDYRLRWGKVDPEGVRKVLCDKHGFAVDRVDAVLARISTKDDARRQRSLDSWAA
jgi:flap endonuclease-1